MKLTLEPPDLRGGSVALLVARSYPEDDGGFRRVVDVRRGEAGSGHGAGRGRPAEHPHKRQMSRATRLLLHLPTNT